MVSVVSEYFTSNLYLCAPIVVRCFCQKLSGLTTRAWWTDDGKCSWRTFRIGLMAAHADPLMSISMVKPCDLTDSLRTKLPFHNYNSEPCKRVRSHTGCFTNRKCSVQESATYVITETKISMLSYLCLQLSWRSGHRLCYSQIFLNWNNLTAHLCNLITNYWMSYHDEQIIMYQFIS